MINFKQKIQNKLRPTKGDKEAAYLRAQAAIAIGQVIDSGKSLRKILKDNANKFPQGSDQSTFKEICFGSIRWYYLLEAITNQLLNSPLSKKHNDLKYLICCGLYQLIHTNIPPHAIVNETVAAARLLNKPWACKLVNKILRQFIRKKDGVLEQVQSDSWAYYAHPKWLFDLIQADWPEHWQQIINENNHKPPFTLRINRQKTSPQGYIALLNNHKIPAHSDSKFTDAVIVEKPIPATTLPGFSHGLCSVQDLAGQKVAELLQLSPEQRILDACAAPGSKTCHILEMEPNINKVVAIDIDAERLFRVKENIQRLQLAADKLKMVLEDAGHTKQWWDGSPFQRILLDAPCSATGVIRRHPDIKLLRRENDIDKQCQLQKLLLKSLWPLLEKNGLFLYTTCSILKMENEAVITKFIKETPDAKVIPCNLGCGQVLKYGTQLLPTKGGPDGFYYCLLQKK